MSKKPLNETRGTVAYHLTKNKDKLWACCSNIKAMRALAIKLLDDESITDKDAVAKAKKIFTTTKDNLFLSCLCTYMLGEKVL